MSGPSLERRGLIDSIIHFCLHNKLVTLLLVVFAILWGMRTAPFDWDLGGLPRDPVPVDAIPDIGENQQIVFTPWPGRSPQDVDDQISYPMTVALLGLPGVKTVRSYSFFGFSSIYVIFKDDVEFYWSRSRVLEKLNSLPAGTLPPDVQPALGPDATALGQIYWYTLEGRDPDGNPTGGWNLEELRSIQDWTVRYGLLSAEGVSEVASVGGYEREYQVDVDPDAMRAKHVTLRDVFEAVKRSNLDVGARTIEVNRVEYVIRGVGFLTDIEDLKHNVVKIHDDVPVYIKDVATISQGPALRRGALDKEGSEAVGGVVVVRYGENPLQVIKNVKQKIAEIAPSLPGKTLPDGTVSKLTIVPFYDRTELINETLGTLSTAIRQQILITVVVVLLMVLHLRSSLLISGILPLAVLLCFVGMRYLGVDANIMALSGIAIAIGTIVDMGIVLCENMLRHLKEKRPGVSDLKTIYRAASEVGSALVTAVSTTIVSFLPVFTLQGAEGKLFKPLAYTKTLALFASIIVAMTIIPPFGHVLFCWKISKKGLKRVFFALLLLGSVPLAIYTWWWAGVALATYSLWSLLSDLLPKWVGRWVGYLASLVAVAATVVVLTTDWLPLGPERGVFKNLLFVGGTIGGLLALFQIFILVYPRILAWCLRHKLAFLCLPLLILGFGGYVWLGPGTIFGDMPDAVARYEGVSWEDVPNKDLETRVLWTLAQDWEGRGKEFMPPLDEGSYLYMPTTMPHASIGECLEMVSLQDRAIREIPEVSSVVGKIGRVESSLDPAPISMVETVINYLPEYKTDEHGERIRFRTDAGGDFVRDTSGELIPDPEGRFFRQWRDEITSADDIWEEIVKAAQFPGATSAPELQPIAARIVMLQSGMRAPMGVKVKGPDLETIEKVGLDIERFLKEVPSVKSSAVIADRIVGKPYLEIHIDREAIARYGIRIQDVQDVVEIAIGGKRITTTVEGRERYSVRVRYTRELRDKVDSLEHILVPGRQGAQIPLTQLAEIRYLRGPQAIKSEDTFLIGYVLLDKREGNAEVAVVEEARDYLQQQEQIFETALEEAKGLARAEGRELTQAEIDALPGLNRRGCTYVFAGSYENQVRSEKRLAVVLPLALFLIFIILYLQFRSVATTSFIFSGIAIAWAGGFLMIWLYAQPWFLDASVFGVDLQQTFQVSPFNLSVAVWVGFIALFGIATDDGVVIATYLQQVFKREKIDSIEAIRRATLIAGKRRVRPCLMTTATTILALLPVLTSTGRGADVMVPMAIPSFGGMTIELVTLLVVPVLYCLAMEIKFKLGMDDPCFDRPEKGAEQASSAAVADPEGSEGAEEGPSDAGQDGNPGAVDEASDGAASAHPPDSGEGSLPEESEPQGEDRS